MNPGVLVPTGNSQWYLSEPGGTKRRRESGAWERKVSVEKMTALDDLIPQGDEQGLDLRDGPDSPLTCPQSLGPLLCAQHSVKT